MRDQPDDALHRFASACRCGDLAALRAALAADVVAVCGGGGRVPASMAPGHGADDVSGLVAALCGGADAELTVETVNGRAGRSLRRAGRAIAVIGVGAVCGTVTERWIVFNPAKFHACHRR